MSLTENELNATQNFLREKFREYYRGLAKRLRPPSKITQREFGFAPFGKEKGMIRHRAFPDADRLGRFLWENVPSAVFYSSAYYTNPDAETMAQKGWLGSNLIFDIDCDHLTTPCKSSHDRWRCMTCPHHGLGVAPEKCPRCGGEKIDKDPWVCDRCLEIAKNEASKLVGILEEDFGVPLEEMTIVFSGHRGYHVHVEREDLAPLGAEERREIADYIMGVGLKAEYHLLQAGRGGGGGSPPLAGGEGWSGRITRALYTLLQKNPEELRVMGLEGKILSDIKRNRKRLAETFGKGVSWGDLRGVERVKKETLDRILEAAVLLEAASIDAPVTTDIHRLIRLPSTLHGKTALVALAIPPEDLPLFNPFQKAPAFTGSRLEVVVRNPPPLRLGGENLKLGVGERVELPIETALLLLCRREAILPPRE